MWEPFDTHGELRGRVRGVALPASGRASQILVWTDAGLFTFWFFTNLHITQEAKASEAARMFDPETGTLTVKDVPYRVYGAYGPLNELYTPPVATEHPAGDRLVPDPDTESLLVLDAEGRTRQRITNYRPAAMPWSLAAFTGTPAVLVVADPLSVRVYKDVVAKGAETPRWAGGGGAQQKQLMRAILDNPDEDTPRLMYADWLDEHGDAARAEFIRLQCQHSARLREHPHQAVDDAARRMFELEKQLGPRWLAELPPVHGVHWQGFHRGFPAVRTGSPTTLVRQGRAVWEAAPVQMATFTDLTETGARSLGKSPWLERLRYVVVEGYYGPRDGGASLPAMLDTPRAAGLLSLTLTSCSVPEDVVVALGRSPHLNALEWLRTSYGVIDEAGVRALLAAPQLKSLKGGPFQVYALSEQLRTAVRRRFPFG